MASNQKPHGTPYTVAVLAYDLTIVQVAMRFLPAKERAVSYLREGGLAEVVRVAKEHYPGIFTAQKVDSEAVDELVQERIDQFIEGLEVAE